MIGIIICHCITFLTKNSEHVIAVSSDCIAYYCYVIYARDKH